MKLPLVGSPIYVEDVFIMLLLMIAVMILQPVYKPLLCQQVTLLFYCWWFFSLLSPLSPLPRQQIGQTRMKLSPVIRLVIRWQEVRWEQWCHPQSGLSEYFFADRQATRQHITPNWQYTFQPDKANLIFMKQNMQIQRQESSTVQY